MPGDHPQRVFKLRYVIASVIAAIAVGLAFLVNPHTPNPTVQEYYSTLESRLGYSLLLGNTRHCGLYAPGTLFPFPVSAAHRRMEAKLFLRLGLPSGSRVLDAGAGSGYVALYMASRGLLVDAIDITPHHVTDATKNVQKHGMTEKITVRSADYHNLSAFADGTFDGVYTMETFVHADAPARALAEFARVLRPGGVLVMHEADFNRDSDTLQEVLRLSHCGNTLPRGGYKELIEGQGFVDFEIEDLTDRVLPLWRLFGVLGYVPYRIFGWLGVRHRFANVMAGVEAWLNWEDGRHISVKAVKPGS